MDKVLIGISILFLGLVGLIIYAIATDHSEADFMTECVKYNKQYECTAMWRAGNSHTQVVPMYIPTGR